VYPKIAPGTNVSIVQLNRRELPFPNLQAYSGSQIFNIGIGKNLALLWQETPRNASKIVLQSVDSIESAEQCFRGPSEAHSNSTRRMDKL
jgi:hypothetical protein